MKSFDRIVWMFLLLLSLGLASVFFLKENDLMETTFPISPWTDADGINWIFLPSWYQAADFEPEDPQTVAVTSANLPTIVITTEGGSMDHFLEDKTVRESGTMEVWDEDGTVSWAGKLKEIRSRGNTTLGQAKQAFQIKIEKDFGLLGMESGSTWVLLANAFDDSGIRNMIALDMARRAGMQYVSQWRCVDLYCNGIYWGNYLLTEKVEVGKGRVETSGGFLIEREFPDRIEEIEDGFVTGEGDCYIQHFPQEGKGMERIQALVEDFEQAVKQKDGRHPQTGRYYAEYIDLDSFARKYILEEILLNVDGGASSAYYYTKGEQRLFAGPPWDYDLAMGNCLDQKESVMDPRNIVFGRQQGEMGTRIYEYLWQHTDFQKEVRDLYASQFRPFLDELLTEGIDRYVELIRPSWSMNKIRWKDVENWNRYYKDYQTEYRYLKFFFDARKKTLDREWLGILEDKDYSGLWKTPETHQVIYAIDGEAWKIDEVADGTLLESFPIPPGYDEKEMEWIRDETDRPVSLGRPILEDEIFVWVPKSD